MIRTKQPQVIDAMNRRSGIVYIKACNRTENEQAQTVSFDVELYTIESTTKLEPVNVEVGTNEEGGKVYEVQMLDVTRPYFKLINRRQAVYRMSTFYSMIGNVTPDQYDQVLISEIDRVNKLTPTGNEVQTEFFYYEWTSEDLEIVSEQELIEMQTPKILN